VVVFSKLVSWGAILQINNQAVEQVPPIKYLGALVNENSDPKMEIRSSRMEQARRTFISQNLLTSRDLNLQLRIRILRCYIFSVLLYGSESWTLCQAM